MGLQTQYSANNLCRLTHVKGHMQINGISPASIDSITKGYIR